MKAKDYQAILRALDNAIVICEQASGFMDQVHREICEQLHAARARVRLLGETNREIP